MEPNSIPRVEASGVTYYAISEYPHRDLFRDAGWKWDAPVKRWTTTDYNAAKKLAKLFAPTAQALAVQHEKAQEGRLAASRATDANVEIPAPEGLTYLPYQKAGIAFASGRENTLIADQPGLGKTIQALGVINNDPSIRKALIVCPASLKINWKRESEKWLVEKRNIFIVKDGKEFAPPDADIVIINYDLLKKHSQAIHSRAWDLLVCDESHALKNDRSARTIEIVGKYKKADPLQARRKIFLTGTPILNRPAELWTAVNYLGMETNWWRFHTRYCAGYQGAHGWDVSGAANLPELEEKLRASIMVRRLKEDVLADLPAKIRSVIPLEIPSKTAAKLIDAQARAFEEAEAAESKADALRAQCGNREDAMEWKEAAKLMDKRKAAFTEISRIRHDLGILKIPAAVEFAAEELETTDALILFAHHHDVVDGIAEGLTQKGVKVVKLTGRDDAEHRQQAVDDFQAGKAQVFLASIEAAGVGLTLTRASRVIFAESSWTPAKLEQAEDRAHRIGQKNAVFVSHLVFDGSLDARMLDTVTQKMDIADRALDGQGKARGNEREVTPDFSGTSEIVPIDAAPIPVAVNRWDMRRQLAENCPDGQYALLQPVERMEKYGRFFAIERKIMSENKPAFLFVSQADPGGGKDKRITEQGDQDKLLAAIVADPEAGHPERIAGARDAAFAEKLTREAVLVDAAKNVLNGFYALPKEDAEGVKFFVVSRKTENGIPSVQVHPFVGGDTTGKWSGGAYFSKRFPLGRERALATLIEIGKEPREAGERFGVELGCCMECGQTLTDDLSRKLGIGPVCRSRHPWFEGLEKAPSRELAFER